MFNSPVRKGFSITPRVFSPRGELILTKVKIEDGDSTALADVKNDGTDNALVVTQNQVPTTTVTGTVTVNSSNFDIRDLTSVSDSVEVLQATPSNLNCTEVNSEAIKTSVELIDDTVKIQGSSQAGVPGIMIAGTDGSAVRRVRVNASGNLSVNGDVYHDYFDATTNAPIKVGGHAYSSEPAAVAADDRVNAYFDLNGYQYVKLGGSLPAGTNAIGKLSANSGVDIGDVDVLTQPARVNTTDTISSFLATNSIMNGTTALTPKYAIVDAATSGDNTLVAAVSGKKIRVLSLFLISAGTVNVRFESGAGGTALTGQMNLAANVGFVLPFSPVGWFETAATTLLNMELSAAISVDGSLVYVEV